VRIWPYEEVARRVRGIVPRSGWQCSVAAILAVCAVGLHVECAAQRIKYGILFISSLFCEHMNLEYVRVHVIYRVS